MPLGDGIRRNVATITPEERTRLKNAIIELNRRNYPGARTDNPVGGVSKWFSQDDIHQATHVHGGPAFLPWHRELCNRFEALLREVDPQLSLHYWDWTTDPHTLFTADFMGSANGVAGEPWLSGGLYNPSANPDRDTSGNPADPPKTITRQVQAGAPVTVAADQAAINAATFPSMRVLLEASHNSAHGFIGGTLGNAHISFRDPIVFLLHSNVDRLFSMWQTASGHSDRLDPNQVYGTEGGSPEITEDLQPWAGGTGTRPWTAPDNQQVVKNCKHPSVVSPPRYDTLTPIPDNAPKSIESVQFPGVFLRLDGSGVIQPTAPGAGVVNCQSGAFTFEKFRLVRLPDGTFNIASVQFPGVFLRLDGSGVIQPTAPGGGTVNCQFGASTFEKFRIVIGTDGTFTIASVQFPGVFLRLDGSGVTQPTAPGAGIVNCQFGAGAFEKFRIA